MNKIFKILLSLGMALIAPTVLLASNEYVYESKFLKTNNSFTGVILEYDITGSLDDDIYLQLRFKDKGKNTEWVDVSIEYDESKTVRHDALVNTNLTNEYQYRIKTITGKDNVKPKVENIKFSFINPKGTESIVSSISSFASTLTNRNSGPRIISRSEWGAKDDYNYATKETVSLESDDKSAVKEEDPEIQRVIATENGQNLKWPMEYMKDIRMIVIHHTASISNLDDPKQAIRNIQRYHAVSRGWGDIGYNFIVDQDGNIYEGRKGGAKVVGGHALPVNKTSVGISVLGNFETQKVPKGVIEGVVKIASQQADLYDLDVTKSVNYKAKTYPVLGGHKDNSKTACPGKNLYNLLPLIRTLVASGTNLDASESSLSKFDFAYVDQNPLREVESLRSGQSKTVEVKLKNVGKKSWNKSQTYLTSLNSAEYSGGLVVASNRIGDLVENSVAPGRTGTFRIQVSAGNTGGNYNIMAQAVLNGETKNSLPVFVPFNVTKSSYGYEIVGSKELKLDLKKNETKTITVNFKNTGDLSWNENYKYVKLGVHRPKDAQSKLFDNKTRIADLGGENNEVKPGETIKVNLRLKAPNQDITITETYAPVIDGLTWFEGGTPLTIIATVGKGTQTPTRTEQNVNLQSDGTNVLGPDIRINISTFNLATAEVSASTKANLVIDGKNSASLNANQKVVINQSGANLTAAVDQKIFTGSSIRIEPTNSENIMTVHNYENRPSWNTSLNDNQFRGKIEARIIDNSLRIINELPIEYYMRGVAEISNNTDTEKIKTIMVAARSYAYFHVTEGKDRKFPGKGYNLDDSPERTQKYLGYGFEKRSPNVVKALQDTAGKVITYNGKTVVIPYFNNSDGKTRSAQEVWGWTDAPYLVSVADSYCKTANQLLGHGVGISGCGATGMAEAGFLHEDIIKYYLKGVDFMIAYNNTTTNSPAASTGPIFSDVAATTEFAEAIRFVKDRGIVEGYADGTYKPLAKINRAEFTKILIEAKFSSIPESSSCFSDVKAGEWYTKYICLAKAEGIIEGYPDKTFKPAQNINIAEALKIVLETFYSDIPTTGLTNNAQWYEKYRLYAKNNQLYIDSKWSNIASNLSRAEMAELIYRVLK